MQWLYDDDDVERMAAAGFEEGGERGRHGEEEQAGRRKRGEREREAIETVDAPLIFSLIG